MKKAFAALLAPVLTLSISGCSKTEQTAEQLAALEAFNGATGATGLWDVDLEESGREICEARGADGRVVVTIHRRDFDDVTGEPVPAGESDVYEIPFALRGGHAVFDTMEYIY